MHGILAPFHSTLPGRWYVSSRGYILFWPCQALPSSVHFAWGGGLALLAWLLLLLTYHLPVRLFHSLQGGGIVGWSTEPPFSSKCKSDRPSFSRACHKQNLGIWNREGPRVGARGLPSPFFENMLQLSHPPTRGRVINVAPGITT